jgi:hypothetical protein
MGTWILREILSLAFTSSVVTFDLIKVLTALGQVLGAVTIKQAGLNI